jgi:hypothetical protein
MSFQQPIAQIVHNRYSCRSYDPASTSGEAFARLDNFIVNLKTGPFNAPNRYQLVLADGEDRSSLRGLGTYGAIKNAPGFIIGASRHSDMDMEDFGFQMEMIVLKATELNLGTCWLGGSFTRSSFSKKAVIAKDETLPAVCSVGFPSVKRTLEQIDQTRKRFGWNELFFKDGFDVVLPPDETGDFSVPLEMVRLAPSAKNYQPWRIVKQAGKWHFFMQRYKGYREFVVPILTGIADLQRIDMGIAMAHFEAAAREAGLPGKWEVSDPKIALTNPLMEYSVTWNTGGDR